MNKSEKKRSPILYFFGIFAVILIVMFIANVKSPLVCELRFPLNNGVLSLETCGNLLTAASGDNKMYIWNWNDLEQEYKIVTTNSVEMVLTLPDRVISVESQNPRFVLVTDLKENKPQDRISLFTYNRKAYLRTDHTGKTVILALVGNSDGISKQICEIKAIDLEQRRLIPLFTTIEKFDSLRGLSICDDAGKVVIVGANEGQGWAGLVDTNSKELLWQVQQPEVVLFFNAIFSPDGKVIYARGSDCTVYKFEAGTGRLLDKWLPVKENEDTSKIQVPQCVQISPDGKLVAAIILGGVYVWECETSELVFIGGPGHKLVSGLAFSPDSRFLATSDMRQSGTIKIWRMPKH